MDDVEAAAAGGHQQDDEAVEAIARGGSLSTKSLLRRATINVSCVPESGSTETPKSETLTEPLMPRADSSFSDVIPKAQSESSVVPMQALRASLPTELLAETRKKLLKRASTVVHDTINPEDVRNRTQERLRTFVASRLQRGISNYSQDTEASLSSVSSVIQREWYMQSFDWSHFVEERFFYCYLSYMVVTVLGGAVAMMICGSMDFWDALFSSASCVSQSGLASLDWSKQTFSTYVASLVLMQLGSMPLLTLWPVLLRRYNFRRQREVDGKVPCRSHGWTQKVRDRQYLEYKALGKVIKIVLAIVVVTQLSAIAALTMYTHHAPEVKDKLGEFGLSPLWHATYLTVSAYQNNGLTLTPNSVEPLNKKPIPLLIVSFLIITGNTCFPIVVRFIATARRWTIRKSSPSYAAYGFVLEHPRRCFTHMFPAVQTLWLCLVALVLLSAQTLCFMQQNADLPVLDGMSLGEKWVNAIFQAASSRTAGLNSVDINFLSAGTTFLFIICMYISTSPTVVIMRYSAIDQDSDEIDITGRPEGHEEDEANGGAESVRSQARRYLTTHLTYLLVVTFLILCLERDRLYASIENSCLLGTPQAYGDFSTYKVMFEIVSAYGTVGLSLGFRGTPTSFSGSWSRPSQVLLVCVMILGRLRGLPDSIDPSVAFTMKVTDTNKADFARLYDDAPQQPLGAVGRRNSFTRSRDPSVRTTAQASTPASSGLDP